MDAHPSRLKFYADDSLHVNDELLDPIASQGTLLAVESIVEHRLNPGMKAYEVKVKWLGLETIEDTWEPLKTMSEDAPQLLLAYVNNTNDDMLIRALISSIDSKQSQGTKQHRD